MMRRRMLLGMLVIGLAAGGGGWVYYHLAWWKKFAVVEEGVLYRSGILHDWQLRQAVAKYRIKTVFSFTHTQQPREQATCDELGVQRYVCHLPGDGVGPDEPYLRFLAVMSEPANHPVLVHCSAGTQRTGGAVALYRVYVQDWPLEQAIEEMIAMGNKGRQTLKDQLAALVQRLATPPPTTTTAQRPEPAPALTR